MFPSLIAFRSIQLFWPASIDSTLETKMNWQVSDQLTFVNWSVMLG